MSSKVLHPDDSQSVCPVAWRQVRMEGQADGARQPMDSASRVAQLESHYQQKVQDARFAGAREGEEAGRKRAAAELQPVLDRLAHSVQDLANLRARLRREAEADVVKLALAIARRILLRELSVDPDALHGLVVASLEKLRGNEISRVRVHPAHVALVTSCLKRAGGGNLVEVMGDPSREPGAVIFETSHGNLDASVDAQLQEIERGLADRLRRQP